MTVDNQMIPDVSDEYRKKKASALLNTIGIPLPSNFQWGNKWTIELPGAEVTICVYKSASKLPSTEGMLSFNISDGEIDTTLEEKMKDVYGKLDSKFTKDIGLTTPSAMFGMATQIENGEISYSYGIDIEGNLIFKCVSKQVLRSEGPVEYSNGYEFEYKIHKSDEQDPETDKVYDFEEIRAKIEAQDPVTQILFFITIIIVAAKAAVELVLTVIRIIVWILGRFLA